MCLRGMSLCGHPVDAWLSLQHALLASRQAVSEQVTLQIVSWGSSVGHHNLTMTVDDAGVCGVAT